MVPSRLFRPLVFLLLRFCRCYPFALPTPAVAAIARHRRNEEARIERGQRIKLKRLRQRRQRAAKAGELREALGEEAFAAALKAWKAQQTDKENAKRAGTQRLRTALAAFRPKSTCAGAGAGIAVAVDLGFAAVQSPRALKSLATQLSFAYSFLRSCGDPPAFLLTSAAGEVSGLLEKRGAQSWAVESHKEHFADVFPPESIVYLSPDAPEPLESLVSGRVYVVGGIVDRTVRKGLSVRRAAEAGVEVRRLPLPQQRLSRSRDGRQQEQLCEKSSSSSSSAPPPSPVLNVEAVVALLACCHANGGDWEAAYTDALPRRNA